MITTAEVFCFDESGESFHSIFKQANWILMETKDQIVRDQSG